MRAPNETQNIPVPMPGYEAVSAEPFDVFRSINDFTAETGSFVGLRLERDTAFWTSLARCEDPFDATHCVTRFLGTAFEDYALEAQRISLTMSYNFLKTVEEFQGQFARPKAPVLE